MPWLTTAVAEGVEVMAAGNKDDRLSSALFTAMDANNAAIAKQASWTLDSTTSICFGVGTNYEKIKD